MRIIGFVIIILLIMNISLPYVQAKEPNHLTKQLDHLIDHNPVLKGALVGISVRSAKTGEVLYEHSANSRLRPASNMKLFTAATALSILSEEYTFVTDLYTDGKRTWKVLNGNLYIKGNGDPTLLKEDLDELATQLKSQGISFIKGNLIADDTRYDDIRYSIDVPWSDESAYYGAQVSALTAAPDEDFDTGTVIIEVTPGQGIGAEACVKTDPLTGYVTLINTATTVGEGQALNVQVTREHGTNIIHIDGAIPEDAVTKQYRIALWDPTAYTLDLFKQALLEQKVTLLGDTKKGEVPDDANKIASHQSMHLSEILVPFMKLSNNGHAEMLVKEMGYVQKGKGSWEEGLDALKQELKQWNIETESLVLRDGSGISHVSGIPANEISQLLYEVQSESWFRTFYDSLPLFDGKDRLDRGTLYSRLKNTSASGRVRAKTGTLSTVSSLAGYIEPREGENMIFSIILNHVLDGKEAKQLEDRIVLALVAG